MHGLGHYIYAGEDLPEGVEKKVTVESANGERKQVEGLDVLAEVFKAFIPDCDSIETLRGFWGVNKDAINVLKEKDEALYNEVLKDFTDRKTTLEAKGEAA